MTLTDLADHAPVVGVGIETVPRRAPLAAVPDPRPVTSYTILDLPVALTALRAMTARVLVDGALGGAVLDTDHPLAGSLVAHAPVIDAWLWTTDPGRIGSLRALARPAGLVVLGGSRHAPDSAPDRTVVAPSAAGRPGSAPVLVDLNAAGRPATAGLLCPTVLGFALDLRGAERDAAEAGLAAVRRALAQWRGDGRRDRPVLLVRGSSAEALRHIVRSVTRMAAGLHVAGPVLRVDLTAAVLQAASSTVVGVRSVRLGSATPHLELDGLPPVGASVRSPAGGPGDGVRAVLLSHGGRVVSARLHGALPQFGGLLLAPGWTGRNAPVRVRTFPAP